MGARSGSCRREPLTVPATGAVRIPDGGLAPTRSAVATTVANSPWRFAAVARASSSALRPPESNACVASSTKRTSKPMSEPARPVVSQQWLGVTPHTAMRSHPARAARRPGRATPGTRSALTSRPEIGLAGDDLLEGVPPGCQGSAASPAPASRGVRTPPVAPHRAMRRSAQRCCSGDLVLDRARPAQRLPRLEALRR